MYEVPNNESKSKLVWTHITKLANVANEHEKIRLDLKYKSIEQIRRRDLQNSIKNDLKQDDIKILKGLLEQEYFANYFQL